jgi:TctA family transporter
VDLLEGLTSALSQMATISVLVFFLLGTVNGLVFGALPGLSGSVGIALMIPLTFGIGAVEAMTLFVAALSGQTFAGSVTAILLNTPGTSPNAATTLDGYPLARQGRGGYAVGISAAASAMGSLIGAILLISLLPIVRSLILSFSFPEFTMLAVMGLAAIAMASRGAVLKGLISGALGLLLSFVGFSPIGGQLRYVFGVRTLTSGIDVVAVLIGLFAVSEVLRLLLHEERVADADAATVFARSQVWEGVRYVLSKPWLLIRSSLVGTGIGIVPAVGGTVASFIAYFQARKTSKDGRFGHGDPRGVLAPEAANDAKDAGAALPSLAFGLPGSADWAIILGAMILHGVNPGPNVIRERPDLVWIAILVLIAASFLTSFIGVAVAPYAVRVTRIRVGMLAPVVGALAITGAFALERQIIDLWVAVLFGVVGYYMRRNNVPVVPLILGLILGDTTERSFIQSIDVFDGIGVFVTRPISLALVIITVALLMSEYVSARRHRPASSGSRIHVSRELFMIMGLFLATGVAATALAYGFGRDSRTFPLAVGWTLNGLVLIFFAVALVPTLNRRFGGLLRDHSQLELPDQPPPARPGPGKDDVLPPSRQGTDAATLVVEPQAGQETAIAEKTASAVASDQPAQTVLPAGESEKASPGRRASRPARLSTGSERRQELWLVAVFAALSVAAWIFGLAISLPVFMIVAMMRFGNVRLVPSLLVTAGTLAAIYFMFSVVLGVPVHLGMLR